MRLFQAILLLTVAGCGQATKEPAPAPTAANDEPPAPAPEAAKDEASTLVGVFGHLETRHGTITTVMRDDGTRYTITSPEGEVLAVEVDEAYLAEHFPVFHELLFGAIYAD